MFGLDEDEADTIVTMNRQLPRPFLKWAGGKTQLLDALMHRKPPTYAAYHEPFLGGGALFFGLYRAHALTKVFLSDSNRELIDAYIAVRDHVDEIIELLSEYPHEEAFYYELRAKDPWKLSLPERAARMIYLNKTGYNGLYRVNRQGKFNVPFGRYKAPRYLDPDNLQEVSKALQLAEIRSCAFDQAVEDAVEGDWVYFDPPYAPLSQTAHFTAYQPDGFSHKDQSRLRDVCLALSERGVWVMISNSDTLLIRDLYSHPPFILHEVAARRAINSNASKRGKVQELIITNYPIPTLPHTDFTP